MSSGKNIVILTPVFDDWESVFVLLAQLDDELKENGYQATVVIVDDGSPTFIDTLDFGVLDLSAIREVIVVTLTRNMGNQRAIATGFGYVASNIECDMLVVMDSDLEDQPKYVPQLIAEAEKFENKIVFANRTRRSEGFVFKVLYQIYRRLYKVLTGMSISVGNFSAVPGRLVKRIAGISEIWSHFPAGIMRARVPFTMMPTTRGKRLYGRGKSNIVALVIHGLSGFAVHADVVGVRIVITIFGIGIAVLAALVLVIAKRFFFDFFVQGWTSLVVIILGLAVIQAFMAAIFMAFLVLSGRNYRQVIPAVDYKDFILETEKVFPAKKRQA